MLLYIGFVFSNPPNDNEQGIYQPFQPQWEYQPEPIENPLRLDEFYNGLSYNPNDNINSESQPLLRGPSGPPITGIAPIEDDALVILLLVVLYLVFKVIRNRMRNNKI